MTEPASVIAMRQLAAEAHVRRTRTLRSAPRRPPVQECADADEQQAEQDLADADT